ncbi:YggS family pyridoxal phosphate-dependent enzyme [Kordiimonas laminariae]|uniref:YggS family pyridoxal phosphate-dependent enzyme n=1 Tax=Kordiimonas laminariae TaxID=2917717 RepID=UPI001FF5D9CE|nr:YggS family pyridoxal phosphate-dependent enzyme [Kordiimonas laminariae]MCK0070175.1 YggS family pyridoxal phosphate-dependent enzyme [Kordiimonas laminariae]
MSTKLKEQIAANIETIKDEVEAMCKHADMPNPNPRLIAVSKIQPQERIIAALEAGQRIFGENRVQEAEERWGELKPNYEGIELHLIGSLQTNKAANAVALFDEIQTVDRIKLARALASEMEKQNRQLPIYVQVNTGKEEQKGGCMVEDLEALLAECKTLGLEIRGLMCIPPVGDDPSLHFALLRKLGRQHGIAKLSMGMSKDYALAASMGATDIRVGTSIFGERDYSSRA